MEDRTIRLLTYLVDGWDYVPGVLWVLSFFMRPDLDLGEKGSIWKRAKWGAPTRARK